MILLFQVANEVTQKANEMQQAPIDISGAVWQTMGLSGMLLLAAIGYFIKVNNRIRKERDDKQKEINQLHKDYQQREEKKSEEYNRERNKFFEKMTELAIEANADRKEMMSLIKQSNSLFGANQDLLRDFSNKNSTSLTELAKAISKRD